MILAVYHLARSPGPVEYDDGATSKGDEPGAFSRFFQRPAVVQEADSKVPGSLGARASVGLGAR